MNEEQKGNSLTEQEQKLELLKVRNIISGYSWVNTNQKSLMNAVFDYLLGLDSFPQGIIYGTISNYIIPNKIIEAINPLDALTDIDDRFFNLVTSYWSMGEGLMIQYLVKYIPFENGVNLIDLLSLKLSGYQVSISKNNLLRSLLYKGGNVLRNGERLTSGGIFVKEQITNDFNNAYQVPFQDNKEHIFWDFLFFANPNLAEQHIERFFASNCKIADTLLVIKILLEKNTEKYYPQIIAFLNEKKNANLLASCFGLLEEYAPKHFEEDELELAKKYFEFGYSFYFYETISIDPFSVSLKIILKHCKSSEDFLINYPKKGLAITLSEKYLMLIFEAYGDKSQIIFEELFENHISEKSNNKAIFEFIAKFNFNHLIPKLLVFVRSDNRTCRDQTVILLAKLGDQIIPEAVNLLEEKNIEKRKSGAKILSLIKSEKAQEILTNFIDTEKNDDTRDTMLEGIIAIISNQNTREDILQKVQKAKAREKLEKPLEKWLDESTLPAIYWSSSNQIIDLETIRFLFYRMSRTKDIRTDIEAKPLIMLIDRTSSGDFAKALIKTYFANGADAKYKFCLTLGGLLGDDEIIDLLYKKVIEFAETSRGKMAEYTVKALALQGSTKALRAVEFFSRKYKAKNKNIGAAANESFILVAEELGISPYDLADSIIPNFGFDGLFRRFEVGDEIFRAFINTDFKIMFFNEDNKLLKSPPKGINKELAEELKEVSKEIKDIVKSQSNRLEQYLIIQRKWSSEKWQSFFLENPIMFVYAVRLIWGAYNSSGELLFTFRCEQDQTLINEDGDEIELLPVLQIGMVHPISLSSQSIDFWSSSLYDANLMPIFPQLNRMVVLLKEEERSLKMSEEFSNVKIGGYSFVNKMDKLGWIRGSIVDAGGIASYYKDFSEAGITAIIIQKGVIGIGYLEENAELGSLMFVHKGKVAFGSYVYDEPENIYDTRLIDFENVPSIVYSEVMADMISLKAIQVQ
ncbi:DUF4132 domain-containing protein [Arcicella aquatica]|uniref:DUF4132 domain-containing protein n=1 Tax=Arcicella aquatica TaxID=217141 RepID=A0ABU5QM70_9BACT|nr:DUF4132 domain-containing protein [Arcicella aquatica]MEA5258166.1 DUF4132 domain-containing protein [Arcicella aquatica]